MEPGKLQLICKGLYRSGFSRWKRPALLAVALSNCIQTGIPPIGGTPAQQLAEAERLYADSRDLYFQASVVQAGGRERNDRGVALEQLRGAWQALSARALERLVALDTTRYGNEDRHAIGVMRETLLSQEMSDSSSGVACGSDVTELAQRSVERLSAATYDCFGWRASRVVVGLDTLDRLSVLSALGRESDAARRRLLFTSLSPVWEAMNGRNEPTSPWRTLVSLRAPEWRGNSTPIERAFASIGMDPSRAESTLVEVLAVWRQHHVPPGQVEPWDWYFETGTAGRRLSPSIGRERLLAITEDFFSSFGADPRLYGVSFDLDPREGKTPVAYTQFGGISRRTADGPFGASPYVFATYREGGFGNLVELLHETAHAIHLLAIETRPAFADWPESDPFTEGIADVVAFEAYEPVWQQKYIGDSASTVASMREKYGSVMMDVAWALFELRMYAHPESDPDSVWSDITSRYLGIKPHPEWSWWAMRGQLIDSPGYMVNYALGAILAADVRSRMREVWGGLNRGDRRLYERLSEELYRFGRSRPAKEVLERFLGRPLSLEPLLRDLRR